MSWYNAYSDTTKRLQQFLQSQPSLSDLLQFPDFIDLLKAYQPRLLDYITNSQQLAKDMVKFITEAPQETDSYVRKHKLPLLMALAIESNTICIVNSFFKINPLTKQPYFLTAFYNFLTPDGELLPLLCGYFSQFNIVLWNSHYKQTIDLIYEAKDPLFLLAKHSYSKAIVNTLLLYLNLDLTRNNILIADRTSLKLQVLKNLFNQISNAYQSYKKQNSYASKNEILIQNISEILIEVVQKYYLITDGKSMLEIVLSQQNITLLLDILMHGSSISLSVVGVVSWIMRYYCISSFNTEDRQNLQLSKRNIQRLEAQPFVKRITQLLPIVIQQVIEAPTLTLYHCKLLQILNISLQLSSKKLSEVVKKSKYIQSLISLLFKFQKNSILHKQTEKLFQQIFNSDRLIYEDYRKYLFCSAQLIEITVGQYLNRIQDLNVYKQQISRLHEGYFSYLMRIIKIYSKIQTNDEQINESIMKRSQLWQKFSSFVLKPYQALCFKQLGSYQVIKENTPMQFSIKYLSAGGLNSSQQINKKVLEQITQEQNMQPFKTVQIEKANSEIHNKNENLAEDALFNVQEFNQPQLNNSIGPDLDTVKDANSSPGSANSPPSSSLSQLPLVQQQKTIIESPGSANKYQQFISKQKVEVDKQIKLQRTNSSEKRLSANKSRVTSPSPKKKKWDTNQQQQKPPAKPAPVSKVAQPEQRKQKISLTTPSNLIIRPPTVPTNKAPPLHPHINSHNNSHNSPFSSPKQIKIDAVQSPQLHKKQPQPELRQSISETVLTSISSLSKQEQLNGVQQPPVFQSRSISASHLLVPVNTVQSSQLMSKSALTFSNRPIQILKVRCAKKQKPVFRRISQKDKALLNLIGFKL